MMKHQWSAARLLPLLLLLILSRRRIIRTASQQVPTTPPVPIPPQPAQIVASNGSSPLQPMEQKPSDPTATSPADPTTAPKYDGITNDANKELIDYDEDILGSLDFVQTLKLADGQARVTSMLAKHHSHDEMYEYLAELNRQYPEVSRLYSIGESVEGRKLWAIELSELPGKHQRLKPEFRYIANVHGNEVVGRELLLHLARLLLENYRAAHEEPASEAHKSTGPKFVRKLLRDTRIHLLPSLNPDGHANSVVSCNYETPSRKGRVNANNVDLNRNFPDKGIGSQVDAGTQPETLAFIEWSRKEPFVLSASLHGGALAAIFPYDSPRNDSHRCPDDDVFRQLATAYSMSHKTMALGKDCYDRCSEYHKEHTFAQGITVGSEWYPLTGGLQDWIYDNTNEFDVTLELGCNQYPPADSLPTYWEFNKKALVNFVREVHKGIKGIITDESGRPLPNVVVHLSDRDHDVRTNSYGEYYRLLVPATYEVAFERPDLRTQNATIQLSHGGMAQIYNIKMAKKNDGHSSVPAVDGEHTSGGAHQETTENHQEDANHSIVVATLVMSVITVMMLILMAGAYIIQKRRFTRSQSVSVELQPRSASTGVSLSGKTSSTSLAPVAGGAGGSSANHPHLSA